MTAAATITIAAATVLTNARARTTSILSHFGWRNCAGGVIELCGAICGAVVWPASFIAVERALFLLLEGAPELETPLIRSSADRVGAGEWAFSSAAAPDRAVVLLPPVAP